MTFTGYFYTDEPGGFAAEVSQCNTSINNTVNTNCNPNLFLFTTCSKSADVDNYIYLHDSAPTEPSGDGSINFTDHTGESKKTYSATVPGYVKSFTSETGFFTSNQDFTDHAATWSMEYQAKYAGTVTSGYTPFIRIEFYKRDSSNNDTLLFSFKGGISTIFSLNRQLILTTTATGSVTTSDRLRVRVYIGEELPT